MQTALDIEQTISACFDQQARLHGDRVAIHTGDESVTFADLNRLATRIAADILSRRGPGAEPVALLLERGIGIVAAILAVLKAGKFYVILDASHPEDRLKQIISDSGTGLVVTDVAHLDRVRHLANETIGILDIAEAGRHQRDERLNVPSSPDDLAMIIYTSGSTGRPKGVTHTHRNVLADTRNVKIALNISPDDRFVWHTSVAFAGSARTIYSALLSGASLYPFDSKRHGFAQLSEWLVRHRITIFRTVPTTYRAFMATLADDVVFPDVRVLSMGGEPLFRPDVHAFHRHFAPHAVLVHPFGPTECMAVCWYVLPHREPFEQHKVPIGYALPETAVQLLDEDGREVGDDEVGEIAVTSPYLSPGYWRDADRTNAVFRVAASGGHTRVYLTGDLGKRSRDGCLTHMGRRDFQVKIRGFRIEVSEIETHLREMGGVCDVVVVGARSESGQSRLVAYFVPNADALITAADLRRHLGPLLPE